MCDNGIKPKLKVLFWKEGGQLQPMKKQLLLLTIVFLCAVWLLFQVDASALLFQVDASLPNLFIPEHNEARTEEWSPGFLVNTEGCRIQDLNPFDEKIKPFLREENNPVVCNRFKAGRLVKSDKNSVYIDWSVLNNSYYLQDFECNSCEFRRVEREANGDGSYPNSVDTSYRFSEKCKKIEDSLEIQNEEFIKVTCRASSEDIYTDYFAFPHTNEDKSKRSRKSDELNVLALGVDAVSRLNLHRQMPKTVEFLKTKLRAVEMLGYNKVGDNTFPNLVPVLSGLSEEELTAACWPNVRSVFDDCPMIWKKYKESGFHTGYAEDSASIGLFNYQKIGFKKQPTDFYGQIYSLVSEGSIGSQKQGNTYLCVGNRLTVELLLDIVRKFTIRLKEVLTWGFFWTTSLSHDFLNYPMFGDDLHVSLMEELLEEGIFNSTIFVYLSDHGIRWGAIRETYQGYIEERLPFVWIAVPEWFEDKYSMAIRNLRTNRRRLTTPYDLHETLLDLINLTSIDNEVIKMRSKTIKEINNRGISLFLPIPETRTCKDAGITENWCTCHTSKAISIDEPIVYDVAIVLVKHLNHLLVGYSQCSKLELHKIVSARMEEVILDSNEKAAGKDHLTDYIIVVETVPGHGLFEATIRIELNGNKETKATVIDPVSRLNTYGNQSTCISHYSLKLYCYCTHKWGT